MWKFKWWSQPWPLTRRLGTHSHDNPCTYHKKLFTWVHIINKFKIKHKLPLGASTFENGSWGLVLYMNRITVTLDSEMSSNNIPFVCYKAHKLEDDYFRLLIFDKELIDFFLIIQILKLRNVQQIRKRLCILRMSE